MYLYAERAKEHVALHQQVRVLNLMSTLV
jgi:hypothetical protein